MHYQQGGGKYPILVSRGSFASREEKLGEMHLFRGTSGWSLLAVMSD
jgi:hypothetical protein